MDGAHIALLGHKLTMTLAAAVSSLLAQSTAPEAAGQKAEIDRIVADLAAASQG